MCLFIDYKIHPNGEPCIATKDIIVYKYGLKTLSSNNILTLFRLHPLQLKQIHETKLIKNGFYVLDGFHAFRNKHHLKKHCVSLSNPKVKEFIVIIPEGSEYYIGTLGDIVSNKIIMYTKFQYFIKRLFNLKP